MINVVEINKKPYGFHFGFRTLMEFSQKYDIQFEEIGKNIMFEPDQFLDLFLIANKNALKRDPESNKIDAIELEDAMDADFVSGGKLMNKLLGAFNKQIEIENKPGAKTAKKKSH